jgi:hypothetical protein
MTAIDEFTRECLTIRVAGRINSFGVIKTIAKVMLSRARRNTFDPITTRRQPPRLCAAI